MVYRGASLSIAEWVGYQIAGVYTNRPHTHLRGDRSEMHFGGLLLETHGPPNRPEALTGEYWTDRKTKGQMTFGERTPKVFTRFADADRAFGASGRHGRWTVFPERSAELRRSLGVAVVVDVVRHRCGLAANPPQIDLARTRAELDAGHAGLERANGAALTCRQRPLPHRNAGRPGPALPHRRGDERAPIAVIPLGSRRLAPVGLGVFLNDPAFNWWS